MRRYFTNWTSVVISAILMGFLPLRAQEPDDYTRLMSLSLEELLKVQITTASNLAEPLSDAPATVIVLTREEIESRGYGDLSQIMEDLPGMDVVRVNGDIAFKNYWRGFRNSFGAPYLFLIDGLPWRDLYYNDAEVMRALPLSNIQRVEIVYGPASSIYGANAFNGVINVITAQKRDQDGSSFRGRFGGGSAETVIGDGQLFYQKDDIRLSLTARFDNGDDYPSTRNQYEWTKDRYVTDRRLWGGFVDSPAAGGTQSPHRHRALDFRGFFKEIELGVQYYELTSSYGLQYAADHVLPNVVWTKLDYAAYARYLKELHPRLNSTTVIRYTGSDVPNRSALVEGFNVTNEKGNTFRVVNFEQWQTLNNAWSFIQAFQYTPTPTLTLKVGFSYEQKNLQKAYAIASGPFWRPDSVHADTYHFPRPPSKTEQFGNRIITSDKSAYFNAKKTLSGKDIIHFGLRYDDNSQYGSATTLRAGWIHHWGPLSIKWLYGEGFQEPSPRVLYGAWTALGSDPDLKPERSRTLELSASLTTTQVSSTLSLYRIRNTDTILNLQEGGRNVGERRIWGLDYHMKIHPKHRLLKHFQCWGYYSYIHARGDELYDAASNQYTDGPVGDIAPHKASLGLTATPCRHLSATLTARYVSSRKTVESNPVTKVPAYAVLDLNLLVKNIPVQGLSLCLKINNLLDKTYFHPGIRTADAGETPGYFDKDGVWHGSSGWLSSLIPQPGRTLLVSLHYDL